jgi:hypothetical protein
MTSWTSFVGQVTRLRRLFARVFARAERRRAHDADEPLVAEEALVAEEPRAGGPPAHWVERVRRGAPGLLEPSFRSLGEPVRPTAEDLSPPDAETEVERRPQVVEETAPVRDDAPAQPAVVRRPPAPRAQPAPARRVSTLRKVVRRLRAPSAVRTVAVDDSRTPVSNDAPVELPAARNPVPLAESTPVAKVPEPPHAASDNRPTPLRAARPATEETEPPPPQRTTVVEFDAPRIPTRTVRAERTARDDAVTARDGARDAVQTAPVERVFDDTVVRRAREQVVAAPAPRRATDVLRAPEPPPQRTLAPTKPKLETTPSPRGRHDPLPTLEGDPWPELPPPLDDADGDVDAMVRAWERQRRLDREQTRL